MSVARFITLEGIEGAGKSTVARALHAELTRRGHAVLLTREPGGTPLAESLRELLLRRGGERMTPTAETLLMFAARAVHLENAIRPALAAGRWVICDRFTDASYAYQGAGRGVTPTLLDRLAEAVHADLWPARTLLLDLPVAAGLERASLRAGAPDRFESEQREFFESHVRPWVFNCCTAIQKSPVANYYRRVAEFTQVFMAIERDSFAIE